MASARSLGSSLTLKLSQVADLREGDLITDIDTPSGPFYRVNSLDLERRELLVDAVTLPIEDSEAFLLRLVQPVADANTT